MGIVAKVSTIMSSENRENLGTFATGTFRHIRDTHSRHTFGIAKTFLYRPLSLYCPRRAAPQGRDKQACLHGQGCLLAWTRMLACMVSKLACMLSKLALPKPLYTGALRESSGAPRPVRRNVPALVCRALRQGSRVCAPFSCLAPCSHRAALPPRAF